MAREQYQQDRVLHTIQACVILAQIAQYHQDHPNAQMKEACDNESE